MKKAHQASVGVPKSGAPQGTMKTLWFNKDSTDRYNNLEDLVDNWNDALIVEYGKGGVFIKTMKYFQHSPPPEPTIVGDATSLTNVGLAAIFAEDMKAVGKANRKMREDRTAIYYTMLMRTSEEARGKLSRNADFAKLELTHDDPLALWKLFHSVLVPTPTADSGATYGDAMEAFINCKQLAGMKIETYYRAIEAKIARLHMLDSANKISEGQQVARFIKNLDPGRFIVFQTDLFNRRIDMPTTLLDAYERASVFRTIGKQTTEKAFVTDRRVSGKSGDAKAKSPDFTSRTSTQPIQSDVAPNAKKAASFQGKSRPSKLKIQPLPFREGTCNRCGNFGHFEKTCNVPTTKREMAALTSEDGDQDSDEEEAGSESAFTTRARVCIRNGCVRSETAMLGEVTVEERVSALPPLTLGIDSMCSRSLFGEAALVSNIRPCKAIHFDGFGGSETVTLKADHAHFGTVSFFPGGPNLVSYGCVEDMKGVRIKHGRGKMSIHFQDGAVYRFVKKGQLFLCDCAEQLEVVNAARSKAYHCVDTTALARSTSSSPSPTGARSRSFAYLAGAEDDDMPALVDSDSENEGGDSEDEADDEDVAVPAAPSLAKYRGAVETAAANVRLYTKKEVAAANRAREFSAAMSFPGTRTMLEIVRSGRVEGIDFSAEDVIRAIQIYGPALESIRGKTTRFKRSAVEPGRTIKIVNSNLVMHVDIAFFAKVPFLISVAKPLGLVMADWLKSREAKDVKIAILKQMSKLTSEGYRVTEVRSDGEGAICAIAEELMEMGVRVSIHAPNTFSAEVDVKIKQLKNGVRAVTVLPYLFPLMLLAWAVYYAAHKINMMPSSVNAHSYSPIEMLLGRPISLSRDLGARHGGKCLAFGSSVEVHEGTTNTMADRTRPGIWLGSKSSTYGSGYIFLTDTKKVVSRDQWRGRPMTASTVERMNSIARLGRLIRWRRETDIEDTDDLDSDELPELAEGERVIVRTEANPYLPVDLAEDDGAVLTSVRADDADTAVEESPLDQLLAEDEPIVDRDAEGAESGGAPSDELTGGEQEEGRSAATRRWHDPSLVTSIHGTAPIEGARRAAVDEPWFLAGDPLPESGEQVKRVRRPVVRYGFAAVSSSPVTRSRPSPGAVACKEKRLLREDAYLASFGKRKRRREDAFVLTTAAALREFGKVAEESMLKELQSIHGKGVFSQRRLSGLTLAQRRKIIRSSMFCKEKFLSTGIFEKLKSRLVAGGNLQDKSTYAESETSSPTVSLQSIYLVAMLAAKEGRAVGTMDVGTAYLNADMKREVLMRVEPSLARLLVSIDPTSYTLESDGSLVVLLNKALYGCLESAKLWFDNLTATLRGMGFRANGKDPCVMNIVRNGHQVTVCIYVDDVLCTSVASEDIDWVASVLKREYGELSVNLGKRHSYLGQTLDFSVPGEVQVTMEGYVRDLLELYEVKGSRATPATERLFEISADSEKLSAADGEVFHSRTAKLLYLSQRARPDILTAVAFLTTRVQKCTVEDRSKLERVLMYLNGCPSLGLTLRASGGIQLLVYVDASFAVHDDMKSHTGAVMTMGLGPIYVSSKKQSLMTKSSTESELVGLSDVLPQAIWTRDFLIDQGYKMPAATLYQDNTSTISLATTGRSKSARTRHIAIRYFFVKDRVDSDEVKIVHMPTTHMIADILTKPLQGDLFRQMRAWLMGLEE